MQKQRMPAASRLTRGAWPYLWLAVAVAVSYALFGSAQETSIKIGMAALLGALGLWAAWLTAHGRLSTARMLLFLVAAGALLRIGYMLYTPYYLRGHDIGTADSNQNAGYIAQIFLYGRLPQTNYGLLYHPPVAFLMEAGVMRLWSFFTPEKSVDTLLDVAKLVPAFLSCALLVVLRRLFEELNMPRRAVLVAVAVLAFQPTFFILSASINNDMAMVFFIAVSLLYTVRWYKKQTFRNILLLAVAIALAGTSKVSGLLVAPLTAVVFLAGWQRARPRGLGQNRMGQFGAFAAVCLPLSLWYMVRNAVLFGQSPGYVLQMAVNGPLYVGNYSFVQRFLSLPLGNLFTQPYCAPYDDYQLLPYVLKNALFGEFTFSNAAWMAAPLMAAQLLLVAFSLAAMVYVLFDRGVPRLTRFLLGGLWVLQIGSFVVFNLRYPFGCTMDFRYIVPTLFSGTAFLGLGVQRLRKRSPVWARRLLPAVTGSVFAFGLFSALFYLA